MRFDSEDTKKIIDLYINEDKSALELSKQFNCACQTVINLLRKNNIKIKDTGYWHKKVELEDIKRDYFENNMSLTDIGKKYNIGTGSLCTRFQDAGIKLRDRVEAIRKIPSSEHKIICNLYLNDKTQSCGKIAKIYNVDKSTVATILKENGIIIDKAFGSRNASWKGGITPLHTKIRNCEKSEFWKRACLERDEYKCKITGETKNLQVHHFPRTFSDIFTDFLRQNSSLNPTSNYDELFSLSQSFSPFWDIDNGLTISEEVHKRLHTKGGITNEEILSLHNQGWSCEKISKYFGKSRAFARSRLISLGVPLRNPGYYNKDRNIIDDETKKLILESYIKGDAIKDILNNFKIGNGQLYSILEKNNIRPGNRKRDQRSDATKQLERVNQLYKSGVTVNEIAKIYEVSNTTIRKILKIDN